LWGGEPFEFFRPVFNIADASISTGVIAILLFQNRFFKETEMGSSPKADAKAKVDDDVQVS